MIYGSIKHVLEKVLINIHDIFYLAYFIFYLISKNKNTAMSFICFIDYNISENF